ncbi:glutamine-hydrolyzing carbamoyl-phosphate synthase small subunit [Clostridiaceae bacterium M8S5]|nr:glutamine-hydrolyzing carbamoyl-phosphate synthase small subunit [Clostridiaceae bacterium M8S5]
MKGILYLEDGSMYIGKGFGSIGTNVGELVFNTSMTGYQEIMTDPSYAGQVVTMTYPLIGNYGVNPEANEATSIFAKGVVVKNISQNPSNYKSMGTLDEMLKTKGVVGVHDVDTRSITKRIRKHGAIKCLITNEDLTKKQMQNLINNTNIKEDWMKVVTTNEITNIKGTGPKVAVIDFGIKKNIIRILKKYGCDITIFPCDSNIEQIQKTNPDGVFLSNGPGNPKEAKAGITLIKKLINMYPIFGICMGHQVLALATGGDTYKMKYGHRGGNHGVYDIENDKVYITSQNHGYAVVKESLQESDMKITHININDKTVEGIKHKKLPVFSVQFHPEGAPGPNDSEYLFEQFINLISEEK